MKQLIEFTDSGLYCKQGNFYIDPWKPVDKAIITHAHSDHARWGSKNYLCHAFTKPLLQLRLGNNNYQSVLWYETIYMNGVAVTLYPAGHIIGSSQIKIEYKGEVWVVSGDYKVENDGISNVFEPVTCNTFITESTFALPIYHWQPQAIIYQQIQDWIIHNQANKITSVLFAYSLGKAQRVLQAASKVSNNIYVHGAIYNTMQILYEQGFKLPPVKKVLPTTTKTELQGSVVIAPTSANGSTWLNKFKPCKTAICSGWMQVRGNARRDTADKGFVLSDHADWQGLITSIKATNAQQVFVTHGFQSVLARYLNEQGIDGKEVKTLFGSDSEDIDNLKDNLNEQ